MNHCNCESLFLQSFQEMRDLPFYKNKKNVSKYRDVFRKYYGEYYFTKFTSTLLLLALPALVLLLSIGLVSPKPVEVNLPSTIPLVTK